MASLDCFEDVVREARVFARPRNMPELVVGCARSDGGSCCDGPGIVFEESEV